MFPLADESLPLVGSVFGIVTAIAATITAAGMLAALSLIRKMRDDWLYIKGVVNGDPNRGELPLREEIKQIKSQTRPETVKQAIHEAHAEEGDT